MKIISNKKDAIQELKRISTRTTSEKNNKINAIVEQILEEVKIYQNYVLNSLPLDEDY